MKKAEIQTAKKTLFLGYLGGFSVFLDKISHKRIDKKIDKKTKGYPKTIRITLKVNNHKTNRGF